MSTVIDLRKPIVVSFESLQNFSEDTIKQVEDNLYETLLISCDEVSRNNTCYPLQDLLRSFTDDRRFTERLQNRVLFGESEHPDLDVYDNMKGKLKRTTTIAPDNICCRTDSYTVKGSDIWGNISFTGPKGDAYKGYYENDKSNLAMSLRSLTPNVVYKEGGPNGKYQVKKYKIIPITWDMVFVPGLRRSRMMDPDQYTKLGSNEDPHKSARMYIKQNGLYASEAHFENVFIDDIRNDLLGTESASIIEDIYGIDISKADMKLTSDNKLVVSTESLGEMYLPLHDTLISKLI